MIVRDEADGGQPLIMSYYDLADLRFAPVDNYG